MKKTIKPSDILANKGYCFIACTALSAIFCAISAIDGGLQNTLYASALGLCIGVVGFLAIQSIKKAMPSAFSKMLASIDEDE